jgi:hypothetical protein
LPKVLESCDRGALAQQRIGVLKKDVPFLIVLQCTDLSYADSIMNPLGAVNEKPLHLNGSSIHQLLEI